MLEVVKKTIPPWAPWCFPGDHRWCLSALPVPCKPRSSLFPSHHPGMPSWLLGLLPFVLNGIMTLESLPNLGGDVSPGM